MYTKGKSLLRPTSVIHNYTITRNENIKSRLQQCVASASKSNNLGKSWNDDCKVSKSTCLIFFKGQPTEATVVHKCVYNVAMKLSRVVVHYVDVKIINLQIKTLKNMFFYTFIKAF